MASVEGLVVAVLAGGRSGVRSQSFLWSAWRVWPLGVKQSDLDNLDQLGAVPDLYDDVIDRLRVPDGIRNHLACGAPSLFAGCRHVWQLDALIIANEPVRVADENRTL